MTNLDQFESVFRAADRTLFHDAPIRLQSMLLVLGDEPSDRVEPYCQQVAACLSHHMSIESQVVGGDQYSDVKDLVGLVESHAPDLICTYRNLKSPAPDYPHSLGAFVDVLTQATTIPVMLLPNPQRLAERDADPAPLRRVIAITDHLSGDDHLVTYAARFAAPDGVLFLAHLEDEATYERYMRAIERIPAIDTDEARASILEQLLKEARDYIQSCRTALVARHAGLQVHDVVKVGHRLNDCQELIASHQIDLVVMNTKDQDQLAMHGLAYPLAVEMRDTPLLLL